ncbi:hypothetical protein ACFXGR_41050 [Streptomyces mirabilis]|uniref:hypothetical protein n=1 Tax=Streptomyces mirabilis TaxID=68239 RepID=UPI0036BA2040
MISTPGCSVSQAAKVASPLGQQVDRGTGLTIDQYGAVVVVPLAQREFIDPEHTRGVAANGSGSAMTRASRVVRLTGAGSRAARRSPARPAKAAAIALSRLPSCGVRCP